MKYFFVSQRQTYKEEHSQGYLWAPRDDVWHHKTMSKVKKGDVIIQYTGEIVGIGIALKDNYDFDRPEGDGFQRWEKQGYKVEVEQFHFITPVKKDFVKEALLENQPKNHAPLNVNGGVNQGYLFPANVAMVDIILRKALEIDQSPQQVEVVKKIQEKLSIDLSKKNENEPNQGQDAMNKSVSIQKIFFGAPGTGKSFKVNSILPNEDIWSVSGEIRKQLFLDSNTAKKAHYAAVLDNNEKFGDIWNVNDLSILEGKLSEVNSVDNVSNPEHSALQAYIKFLKEYKFERVFRTTFHPDYDYAQFVGAYKPRKEDDQDKITYSFVPQVFAKAYAAAWKQYFAAGKASTDENQVYLVIEEINRGNCAQIFGDIFQLLDRVNDGEDKCFSQYSIDADSDFVKWLKTDSVLNEKSIWTEYEKRVGEGKLKLPPNLNILATMNTSDQSLFPMDSAFKRRFDWEYVPIRYKARKNENGEKIDKNWDADEFKISFKYKEKEDGKEKDCTFHWIKFLKKINADIYKVTQCEDKQMGEFFIKPKNEEKIISLEEFRSKVLFYLWDSVYKDETDENAVFHFKYPDENGSVVTFQRLFEDDFGNILLKILERLDDSYNGDEFKDFKIFPVKTELTEDK